MNAIWGTAKSAGAAPEARITLAARIFRMVVPPLQVFFRRSFGEGLSKLHLKPYQTRDGLFDLERWLHPRELADDRLGGKLGERRDITVKLRMRPHLLEDEIEIWARILILLKGIGEENLKTDQDGLFIGERLRGGRLGALLLWRHGLGLRLLGLRHLRWRRNRRRNGHGNAREPPPR